jgi:Flp pilus assembly pilin Flp
MNLLSKLWRDESGVLLSAEAAIVGTVAVVGISTGLTVVAKSVNEELKDVGLAIRSLDQSYNIPARKGCAGGATAGSAFQQAPVKKSLAELCEVARKAEQSEKSTEQRTQKTPQSERMRRQIELQKKRRKSESPRKKARQI